MVIDKSLNVDVRELCGVEKEVDERIGYLVLLEEWRIEEQEKDYRRWGIKEIDRLIGFKKGELIQRMSV